jgi:hypothetical protein
MCLYVNVIDMLCVFSVIPLPIAIPGLTALTLTYVYGVYSLVDEEVQGFCKFVWHRLVVVERKEGEGSDSCEERFADLQLIECERELDKSVTDETETVEFSSTVSTTGSSFNSIVMEGLNTSSIIRYDQDCEV